MKRKRRKRRKREKRPQPQSQKCERNARKFSRCDTLTRIQAHERNSRLETPPTRALPSRPILSTFRFDNLGMKYLGVDDSTYPNCHFVG
jgi:hypothetical protein